MILKPNAKPVRIRIKVGENECSTVEEVRENFSVKELYPLYIDGRLSRWLRQRNETDLADKVDDLRKIHTCESIEDYTWFISLFFDDIEKTLTQYGMESNNVLSAFADETHKEQLLQIFELTKSIDAFSWNDSLKSVLSISNYMIFFENENIRNSIYDRNEWGVLFSQLVRSDDDFKSIFHYFNNLPKNQEFSNDFKIFIESSEKRQYNWYDILRDQLDLDDLLDFYSLCPDMPGWGRYFAEKTSDWESDSKKVIDVLKSDDRTLDSYFCSCDKKGFPDARRYFSQWYLLANSEEYDILIPKLQCWNDRSWYYNRCDHGLKSDLGIQIYEFSKELCQRLNNNCISSSSCFSDPFINSEIIIMREVDKRYKDNDGNYFHESAKQRIQSMDSNTALVSFVLDDAQTHKSFEEIANFAVRLIVDKLNENRKCTQDL